MELKRKLVEKAEDIQNLIFFTSEKTFLIFFFPLVKITIFEICMLFHQYFPYFINLSLLLHVFLSAFSSSWCHGLAVSFDCNTPLTVRLTFCVVRRERIHRNTENKTNISCAAYGCFKALNHQDTRI